MAKKEKQTPAPVDIIRAGEVLHALKMDAENALQLADEYRKRNNGKLSPGAQAEFEAYMLRHQ